MRELRRALLIAIAGIGGALAGAGYVGHMPDADAQNGANTRVFTLANGTFPPAGEAVHLVLGNIASLDLGRDYHFTLTGTVDWNDDGSGTERVVSLAFDLDGFDVAGNAVDWDSQMFPRIQQQDNQIANRTSQRAVVEQSIVNVPDEIATLRLQVLDQSGQAAPFPIHYNAVRLTMTPTGPPF